MLVSSDALAVLVLALLLDALLGDPDWLWRRLPHPVAWLGALVALGDRLFNDGRRSEGWRRVAGTAWLGLVLLLCGAAGWLLDGALRAFPGGPLLAALAASLLIAQRSLHEHVGRVREALAAGGLEPGRRAVSMIVGRDTTRLDEAGISRAAIESAAENFSDGVVAPCFWFAVGGLPGLIVYKAVNTADSMIGHLSERHRAFGWAAARLDDVLNLLPARLSALLIGLASPLAGGPVRRTLRAAWRDAGLHRSPNAGWPEAAMAGALDLALGGPRVYAAGPVEAPFLYAEGRRDANRDDIARALRVMAAAALLHAILYAALAAAALLGA